MGKNLLNKNLILYKFSNLAIIQQTYLILISVNNGWVLIPLLQKKNLLLENIIFGFNRLYKFFFKIKGFGFKWKYQIGLNKKKQNIYFKVGYTHRISLIPANNSKYILKKRRFIVKNRSYKYIRNYLNLLFLLYKDYLYNKKGIYLRGTEFKLKLSKKKSKF
jgi:hypothetical protein